MLLLGHKGSLNSCDWSYSSQYLLTASSDSTAAVWSRDGEIVFTIDRKLGNMSAQSADQKVLELSTRLLALAMDSVMASQ